jgi:hypothetical protein
MYRNPKRGVPLTGVGDVCFRHGVCESIRRKEAQASTLDGLGTVAVLMLLFFGLMFL